MYKFSLLFGDNFKPIVAGVKRGFGEMKVAAAGFGRTVEVLDTPMRRLTSHFGGLAAGAVAGLGLQELGMAVHETSVRFENYQTILEHTFQSAEKAGQAMAGVRKWSILNRQDVDAMTSSYITLVGRGFAPTYRQLGQLADFALSKKKPVDQLVEAILDAETGEFERLTEFGHKMEKTKTGIYSTFNGIRTFVGKDTTAIRGYILGLGDGAGVKGMTAKLAQTTGGMTRDMKNQFTELRLELGVLFKPLVQTGLPMLSSGLRGATEFLKAHGDTIRLVGSLVWELGSRALVVWGVFRAWGALQAIPGVLAKGLFRAGAAMIRLGWHGAWVLGRLRGMALAAWNFGLATVRAAGQAVLGMLRYRFSLNSTAMVQRRMFLAFGWARIVAGFAAMRLAAVAYGQAAWAGLLKFVSGLSLASVWQGILNTVMMANPVGLILGGVVALSAGFYLLFKGVSALFPGFFGGMMSWFKKAWDFIYTWFVGPLVTAFKWLTGLGDMDMGSGDDTMPWTQFQQDPMMPTMPGGSAGPGGGGSGGGGFGLEDKAGGMSGGEGGSIKNIYITVQRLVDGGIHIHNGRQDTRTRITDEVKSALLTLLNDANLVME